MIEEDYQGERVFWKNWKAIRREIEIPKPRCQPLIHCFDRDCLAKKPCCAELMFVPRCWSLRWTSQRDCTIQKWSLISDVEIVIEYLRSYIDLGSLVLVTSEPDDAPRLRRSTMSLNNLLQFIPTLLSNTSYTNVTGGQRVGVRSSSSLLSRLYPHSLLL